MLTTILANFMFLLFQDDFSVSDGAGAAAGAAFFLVFLVIWLGVMLVMIASMWKVFTKAGEPGWAAIVPVYNLIILVKILDKPIWYALLCFIPFIGVIVGIYLITELAKKFGQSMGFAIGLILLPIIFFPILGFGSAQYRR